MRENSEKMVKNLLDTNKDSILYYHVFVTYYNGTPVESNFPSQITVTFGQLTKNGNKYDRSSTTTLSRSLEKPPSINKTNIFDINSIGETTLARDLGISIALTRNILQERKESPKGRGRFKNEKDFLSRMNDFYNNIKNLGHRANFETEHWPIIQKLIKDGKLKI